MQKPAESVGSCLLVHDHKGDWMFARVITAHAGPEGFGKVLDLAEQQVSAARQRPGFQAFYLLADDETGNLITLSFWETREQMEEVARGTATGIHDQGIDATGLSSPRLETYEVKMQA
jgi:heme-degrading monooxygenase HmoA